MEAVINKNLLEIHTPNELKESESLAKKNTKKKTKNMAKSVTTATIATKQQKKKNKKKQ